MKSLLKPKYLEPERSGQRERWLISYTDFITILLILFIAIAAQGVHSAQIPQPAPKPAAPKPAAPNPPAPKSESQAKAQNPVLLEAQEKLRSQGLDTHLEKRGLVISLPQAILFPSGDDRVLPDALPVVSQVADVIAAVPNKVALVGHADSIPIHNQRFHNNWELSAARSLNLLQLLSTRYGIEESRLSVESFGSNNPKNSNDTEAGRAENRRVEILLLDESVPN